MTVRNRSILAAFSGAIFALTISACSPKVGSEAWCEAMKEKPKGDWSANEVADFAKHCVFK